MRVKFPSGYRKRNSVHGLSPHPTYDLFADEFRENVVDDRLDFPFRQTGRMRVARGIITQVLSLQPITVRVLVGVFVEMRHFCSRTPTGNHLYQLITIEMRLVQIGGSARRARIAPAVTIDAVTELTVRLVLEQTLAERCVLRKYQIDGQQQC